MSLISRGIWRLAELEFGVHQAMYKVAVLTGSDSLIRGMLSSDKTRLFEPESLRSTKEVLSMVAGACEEAIAAIDKLLASENNHPGDDKPAIVTRRAP